MVHPLLLPNVLSQVFNYFTALELKTLRQVNLDWNHAACITLQHKKSISLKSIQSVTNYVTLFSKSIEILGSFPHSVFKIHHTFINKDYTQVFAFVQAFHPFIRELSLTLGPGFLDIESLKTILDQLSTLETLGLQFYYYNSSSMLPELDETNSTSYFTLLPSLKCLKVDIECYEVSWTSATKVLLMLFNSAPNIKTIMHSMFCIPPTKCRIPSKMNIFLTELLLEEHFPENCLRNVSNLNFILKLTEENVKLLMNRKFRIKRLFVNCSSSDEDELCVSAKTMRELLAQFSTTLEQLSLDFPWCKEVTFGFRFSLTMPRLSYLSLNGYQGLLLSLLEKLPRLRSLELSQVDLHEILPAATDTDTFPSVSSLRLDFCSSQTSGVISRLSRIFPKLGTLDMNHVKNDGAKMIFQKMKCLTHLRLQGDELSDQGICGIPDDLAKDKQLINCSSTEGDALRKQAFIGDLPQLRYLKLEAYQLTEASIQHGIVHCTSLHFVSMDTRIGKEDPTTTVTRTFRLSEYGRNLQDKGAVLILQEELTDDEDEGAEEFFQLYEKGLANDLLFV